MNRLFKVTYNVTIERLSDGNYEVSIVNFDNIFYIISDLKKISNDTNLRDFFKNLINYYNYDNHKPVFFERKGKIYYYKNNKIKEVNKKWENLIQLFLWE